MTAAALDTPWLITSEAARYARCSEDEMRAALASGELRGNQRKAGGRWRIHRDDIDAWLRGERPTVTIPAVTRQRPHTDGHRPAETERGR